MAQVANTSWYRTGTVEVTQNNATITGTNTKWMSAGINPGATFRLDEDLKPYEVLEVVSDTVITLRTPILGTTGTGKTYSIDRNFQSTPMASLCADVATVMHKYETHIDTETNTVTGKNAYEIACENGFVGTESQWLESITAYGLAVSAGFNGTLEEWQESLKADNEWSTLDARTDALTYNNAGLHNSIYRGKNLGEFTADHLAAIRNGSFLDMWIGDFFVHNGKKDIIAAFNYECNPNVNNGNTIMLYRATALQTCADYIATYNRNPSGTEGEEDYDPGTVGNCYATSNWMTVVMPKFVEEIEATYSIAEIKLYRIFTPMSMNGVTPTAWTWHQVKAHLPTMAQLGFHSWSVPDIFYKSGLGAVTAAPQFASRPLPLTLLNPGAYVNGTVAAEHLNYARSIPTVLCTYRRGYYMVWDTRYGGPDGGHSLHPVFCIG